MTHSAIGRTANARTDEVGRDLVDRIMTARSFLFVPGDRPTRFDSALKSTADVVVVDLEDAVAAPAREEARSHVVALLQQRSDVLVRVNAPSTDDHRADLAALQRVDAAVGVMLAKCESADAVSHVREVLGPGAVVLPLLETAAGLRDIDAIARSRGVVRLAFGSIDYALDCGCEHDREPLLLARSTLVTASRAAGLPQPVDGVSTRLDDAQLLADDTQYARRLGFAGKLCVHPRQTDVVNDGFAPSADDVAWARRVLAASVSDGRGAVRFDDEMVDEPVRLRARRIVHSAHAVAPQLDHEATTTQRSEV